MSDETIQLLRDKFKNEAYDLSERIIKSQAISMEHRVAIIAEIATRQLRALYLTAGKQMGEELIEVVTKQVRTGSCL
jgi:hypothetical protein